MSVFSCFYDLTSKVLRGEAAPLETVTWLDRRPSSLANRAHSSWLALPLSGAATSRAFKVPSARKPVISLRPDFGVTLTRTLAWPLAARSRLIRSNIRAASLEGYLGDHQLRQHLVPTLRDSVECEAEVPGLARIQTPLAAANDGDALPQNHLAVWVVEDAVQLD